MNSIMNGDIIVVGTGFSGSVIARKIAEELNVHVKVIEKRSHIGGNMYDEYDEKGILIHKYGPHFIYTDKYEIIEYLQTYTELFQCWHKLLSYINDKYVRLPFNFETAQQLLGPKKAQPLLKKLKEAYKGEDRVSIIELKNSNDKDIREYANILFEKAYRPYMEKQWGIPIDKLDQSVINRVLLAMNYDERYQNKDFQFMPKKGYTELFRNMLDHGNINVELNTDALDHIKLDDKDNAVFYNNKKIKALIFTGAIDELFSCKYGALPYRSLKFEYEYSDKDSVLPSEIISYPQAVGYTRRTEYKKIMFDGGKINGSTTVTEYPIAYDKNAKDANIPFYPVITSESSALHQKYIEDASKYGQLFLCGRLAEFKYYNMDHCIENALQTFERIKEYLLSNNYT